MPGTFFFVYSAYENIGIEYLSAILRRDGYRTDLLFFPMLFNDSMLDIATLGRFFSDDEKVISSIEGKPSAFFFNVVTDHYRFFLEKARVLKRKFPGVPVVFGGIHPSSVPEEVLSNPEVDYVCVGEGDNVITGLAEFIEGKTGKIPRGIWYRKDGETVRNGSAVPVTDLDLLPFPDKELFYSKVPFFSGTYTIFTTRGCPFSCTYCINSLWYGKIHPDIPKVRRRSPENVIAELEKALSKRGYDSVMFEDDIFVLGKEWHWKFISLYNEKIRKPFVCVLHPEYAQDTEILESLRKAGCIQIEIGIQTLNSSVRKKMLNRFETNSDIVSALRNLHRSGIPYNIDHIAGLPGDSPEWHEKAILVYSRYRPNRILYFFITSYPGTGIEEICLENGEISGRDIELMRKGMGNTDETTGSVSADKASGYENLRFLFGWVPLLPHFLVKILVRSGIYRKLPKTRIITKIIPSIIATLTGNEPRGKVILKRYLYFMFRRILP